jgi:hypothetical protein
MEFSIDIILPPQYGPGVALVSKRNEYQEYFLEDKSNPCI